MLKCKNSRASRNYELLLGFRPGSLLFLRGRLFRCLLFGGGFLFRGNRPSTPFAGNTAQDFARSCRKLDLSELVFGTFLAALLNRGPRSGRRTCGRVFRFGHIPTIFEDSRLSCGTPSDSDGNGYIATSASDSARRERLYCRSHHCQRSRGLRPSCLSWYRKCRLLLEPAY